MPKNVKSNIILSDLLSRTLDIFKKPEKNMEDTKNTEENNLKTLLQESESDCSSPIGIFEELNTAKKELPVKQQELFDAVFNVDVRHQRNPVEIQIFNEVDNTKLIEALSTQKSFEEIAELIEKRYSNGEYIKAFHENNILTEAIPHYDREKIIPLLIDKLKLNIKEKNFFGDNICFKFVAQQFSHEFYEIMVNKYKLDINCTVKHDHREATPLSEACDYCNKSAVESLLKLGAKITVENKLLHRLFMGKINRDVLDITNLLIANRVSILDKEQGRTLLHTICRSDILNTNNSYVLSVVRFLINNGVDVKDICTQTGVKNGSALYLLFEEFNYNNDNSIALNIAHMLLEAGADPNYKDADGCSIIEKIIGRVRFITSTYLEKILKLFIRYGGDIKTKYRYAPLLFQLHHYPDKMQILLDIGADINELNESAIHKNSPNILMHAINCGCDKDTVKFLIEKGVNVKHKDSHDRNILHILACEGTWTGNKSNLNLDMLEILLENPKIKKMINNKNSGGNIPLMTLLNHSRHQSEKDPPDRMDISKALVILLKAGSNLSIRNYESQTAFDLAVFGSPEYYVLQGYLS